MSSLSLREQLLQAGLVNEEQVKNAERQAQRKQYQGQKQQPRAQRNGPTPQEIAAQKQAEAKAARDQELNRKQQEKARRKALYAQIRELVTQNRITRPCWCGAKAGTNWCCRRSRRRSASAMYAPWWRRAWLPRHPKWWTRPTRISWCPTI
jgi:hypothetical protein